MRILLSCFAFLIALQLQAQFTKRVYLSKEYFKCEKDSAYFYRDATYDEDTVIHGRIKTYYMTGQLYGEAEFYHGVERGTTTYWYRNGQKMYEGVYFNGGERILNSWLPTGKPQVVNGSGYFKEFYPHNNYKIREGKLVDGVMDSTWNYWFPNGQQRFVFNFVNGEENILQVWDADKKQLVVNGEGTMIWYYASTKVKAMEGEVINGKRDGKWTIWNKDGSLDEIANYDEGIRDGEYKAWYMNGKMKYEYTFKDGKATGNYTYWYWNGNKMEEGVYGSDESYVVNSWDVNGKPEVISGTGFYSGIYVDGLVSSTGKYHQYSKTGWWKTYNVYGLLVEEDIYSRGIMYVHNYWDHTGKQTLFNGNGIAINSNLYNRVTFNGEYKDGLAHGRVITFQDNGDTTDDYHYVKGEYFGLCRQFEKGIVTVERNYVGKNDCYYKMYKGKDTLMSEGRMTGELVYLKNYWNDNGKQEVVNGSGEEIDYYSNGLVMRKGVYVNGYMQGLWKEYYETGQVYTEAKYEKGLIIGPFKKYYPNGKLEYVQVYKMGEPIGEYIEYYENGKVRSKGLNTNGKREGLWAYYLSNGEKEMDELYKNNILQYGVNYATPAGALYYYVSDWPQPEQGYNALQQQIRTDVKRFRAPTLSLENDGVVQVVLVLETDGTVSTIDAMDTPLGGYYKTKAMDMVKKHAKMWSPARLKGKPVRTSLFYPVSFDTTVAYRAQCNASIVQQDKSSKGDSLVTIKKAPFAIEMDFPEHNNEKTIEVYAISDPALYAKLQGGLPLAFVINSIDPKVDVEGKDPVPTTLNVSSTSSVEWVYEDSLSHTYHYAKQNGTELQCFRNIDSVTVVKPGDLPGKSTRYALKDYPYKDLYLLFVVRKNYDSSPLSVEYFRKCVHVKFE